MCAPGRHKLALIANYLARSYKGTGSNYTNVFAWSIQQTLMGSEFDTYMANMELIDRKIWVRTFAVEHVVETGIVLETEMLKICMDTSLSKIDVEINYI